MERKITLKMREWKDDPAHRPLIVTGCRQIGKTYSIREFVSKEYRTLLRHPPQNDFRNLFLTRFLDFSDNLNSMVDKAYAAWI